MGKDMRERPFDEHDCTRRHFAYNTNKNNTAPTKTVLIESATPNFSFMSQTRAQLWSIACTEFDCIFIVGDFNVHVDKGQHGP